MAGWLSRATSLFQQPPPPPEPFEVECDCGGKVVGQRNASHQRPACPVCERPVFVLPVNIYPRPKPKKTSKEKPSKSTEDTKSGRPPGSVVRDDLATDPDDRAKGKHSGRSKRDTEKVKPSPALEEEMLTAEPHVPLMTPLRLIGAAIVLIGALTIGGLWHRHRMEFAKSSVLQARDAGMAALQERDYPTAAKELGRARVAVDVLGRKDKAAEEIRRLSRESIALANLETSSLIEFLQDTLANTKPGQASPVTMSSIDKGAWVLFDAPVLSKREGKQRCLIDAPVQISNGMVHIEIESPVLYQLAEQEKSEAGVRAIFAAQLDQLSVPAGAPPTSVLTLNGKTAFLWSSYDTYAAIGYQPFDAESELQTRKLLEHQQEFPQ